MNYLCGLCGCCRDRTNKLWSIYLLRNREKKKLTRLVFESTMMTFSADGLSKGTKWNCSRESTMNPTDWVRNKIDWCIPIRSVDLAQFGNHFFFSCASEFFCATCHNWFRRTRQKFTLNEQNISLIAPHSNWCESASSALAMCHIRADPLHVEWPSSQSSTEQAHIVQIGNK